MRHPEQVDQNGTRFCQGQKGYRVNHAFHYGKLLEIAEPESFQLHFRRWRWWRQISGNDYAFKHTLLVSAVAEGFVLRLPATAERHLRASAEAKDPSLRVDDLKISFDLDGPIVSNRDFRCRHFAFSRD